MFSFAVLVVIDNHIENDSHMEITEVRLRNPDLNPFVSLKYLCERVVGYLLFLIILLDNYQDK